MNFEDFIVAPQRIPSEKWQLGSLVRNEIPEAGVALLFVSDFRGAGGTADPIDFKRLRQAFYSLSALDFEVPVGDLGDLVSGKTSEDTHYILQEVLSACHYKNTIPVIVGGSDDLSLSLFSALNFHQKNIYYTKISNTVSLSGAGEGITEENFLSKILSSKHFSVKDFSLLGYQKHQNEINSIQLIGEVDFDVVRLADMMNCTENTEPYFRTADLVTLNCNAVESFAEPFSIRPEVNGLNRREICAYMKEAGLSENLKSVGIFNYNFNCGSQLNTQLLAQMLWYLIEGINILRTHPSEKELETFWVMAEDREYAFKRDTFTNLWYFGSSDNLKECIPCSRDEYETAKKGMLPRRLMRKLHP